MNNPYGIYDRSFNLILDCISKVGEVEEAIIFGSRAMGNYKKGSDIDLVLKGKRLNYNIVSKISGILNEDLPIPYFFDVLNYNSIKNKELIKYIDTKGETIFEI